MKLEQLSLERHPGLSIPVVHAEGELWVSCNGILTAIGMSEDSVEHHIKRLANHPFFGLQRRYNAVGARKSGGNLMVFLEAFDSLAWLSSIAKGRRTDESFGLQWKVCAFVRDAARAEIANSQSADPVLIKRVALLEQKMALTAEFQEKQSEAQSVKKRIGDVDKALSQLDEDTKNRQGLLNLFGPSPDQDDTDEEE